MRWVLLLLVAAACSEERPRLTGEVAGVHPAGFAEPSGHGVELASRNWDFALCAKCHGEDFRGGASGVSCVSCHAEGPTACTTCHGTPPASGAHASHDVSCASCHVVPQRWDDPGHIVNDAAPAEVIFGGLGALTPNATYAGGGCQNVYCHAGASPTWSPPAPGNTCGRCHSLPPPSHAGGYACATCHPSDAPHIDGTVQLGREAGCGGCHLTAATAEGPHRAHTTGPAHLRGPVPCAECHAVPGAITDPGHIDSGPPAEVLASLGWEPGSQTCGTAWCHGASAPHWPQTGEVFCGSCHGLPPTGANHIQDVTLDQCVLCHSRSVDGAGNLIFTGSESEHMDGNVDFN